MHAETCPTLTVEMYEQVVREVLAAARKEWFLPPHRDEDYLDGGHCGKPVDN